MLRIQNLLPMLCGVALLAACSSDEPPADSSSSVSSAAAINSIDISFESRGVMVPATIVTPANRDGKALPLVVMAHGHGGSRQEGGGFEMTAEAMAHRGIASIRMDFPGCGDSTESFADNNLTNMLLDLQAARKFVASEVEIDPDRVGLLGFSMGGRLVALLSEIDPTYRAMVTWAPAISNGAAREMLTTFGGPEAYAANKQRANAEGSSVYTTEWGSELEVGPEWFRDVEASQPLIALAKFSGPLLVIYGDADNTVTPKISTSAVAAATSSSEVVELEIPGAGHGLGFYTDRPEVASLVVESSADFLAERL